MTFEQLAAEARQLPIEQRKKLVTLIVDSLAESTTEQIDDSGDQEVLTDAEARALLKPDLKTGAELVAMLAEMPPVSFVDPEIDDPMEWVKAQRRKNNVSVN